MPEMRGRYAADTSDGAEDTRQIPATVPEMRERCAGDLGAPRGAHHRRDDLGTISGRSFRIPQVPRTSRVLCYTCPTCGDRPHISGVYFKHISPKTHLLIARQEVRLGAEVIRVTKLPRHPRQVLPQVVLAPCAAKQGWGGCGQQQGNLADTCKAISL